MKCKKCLTEMDRNVVQLELNENEYTEDIFEVCPNCGEVEQISYKIIDSTPKIGYDYYEEYYNNDF